MDNLTSRIICQLFEKIKICRCADGENGEWKIFNDIHQVVQFLKGQKLNASYQAANNALKGRTKSSCGYWIRYVENKNEQKVKVKHYALPKKKMIIFFCGV